MANIDYKEVEIQSMRIIDGVSDIRRIVRDLIAQCRTYETTIAQLQAKVDANANNSSVGV